MYKSICTLLLTISLIGFNTQSMAKPSTLVPQDEARLQLCIDRVDPINPSPLTRTDQIMIVADCIEQVTNDQYRLQLCIDHVDPINPSPLTRTDRIMIMVDCIQ